MNDHGKKISFWNNPVNRGRLFQVLVLGLVGLFIFFLYSNVQSNLTKQNIASGFGFFGLEAGFEISETLIDYWSDDSYLKALSVGLLNTLKVALIGNFLAIFLGILIGTATLSHNWLINKISRLYIEVIRNIPLLLQLFFWYALFTEFVPGVRNALNPIGKVYLSNRGFFIPRINLGGGSVWPWATLFCAFIASYSLSIFAKKKREKTGKETNLLLINLLIFTLLPFISWIFFGGAVQIEYPSFQGFNFSGGYSFSPEFISLLLGLVTYTAAFNAEIVRSGIVSVDKGQWEAAESLGLRRQQTLKLVILPQALRVILPPLTSQILNLTKNSSLAVAIAYPDFVSVTNTTMNQTGQAVECVVLIMAVYLIFSLTSSFVMNLYNKKVALVSL